MAQFPFGFMDPRNPYPTGYTPIASTPSVPSIGGGAYPFTNLAPPMLTQATQVKRLRNPALTTSASTLSGGDKDENGNLISYPNSQDAAPSGAAAQTAATAQQNKENQTNMFGLTPEQMQQRMQRDEALQRYQMGLSGMGVEADTANRFEKFGEGFRPGIGGRGTAGRINSALSGAAEGYTAGAAMRQRKEMLEAIKQLRDQYGGANDAAKANAALGLGGGGGTMEGEGSAGLPATADEPEKTDNPAEEKQEGGAQENLQSLLDAEQEKRQREWEAMMLQQNQSAGGGGGGIFG